MEKYLYITYQFKGYQEELETLYNFMQDCQEDVEGDDDMDVVIDAHYLALVLGVRHPRKWRNKKFFLGPQLCGTQKGNITFTVLALEPAFGPAPTIRNLLDKILKKNYLSSISYEIVKIE